MTCFEAGYLSQILCELGDGCERVRARLIICLGNILEGLQ
jgi:hypothetical protein